MEVRSTTSSQYPIVSVVNIIPLIGSTKANNEHSLNVQEVCVFYATEHGYQGINDGLLCKFCRNRKFRVFGARQFRLGPNNRAKEYRTRTRRIFMDCGLQWL